MVLHETGAFVRQNGRAGLWQLAAAIAAAASALAKALRRRRRAPPISHLSRHLRRDIGLERY